MGTEVTTTTAPETTTEAPATTEAPEPTTARPRPTLPDRPTTEAPETDTPFGECRKLKHASSIAANSAWCNANCYNSMGGLMYTMCCDAADESTCDANMHCYCPPEGTTTMGPTTEAPATSEPEETLLPSTWHQCHRWGYTQYNTSNEWCQLHCLKEDGETRH